MASSEGRGESQNPAILKEKSLRWDLSRCMGQKVNREEKKLLGERSTGERTCDSREEVYGGKGVGGKPGS